MAELPLSHTRPAGAHRLQVAEALADRIGLWVAVACTVLTIVLGALGLA